VSFENALLGELRSVVGASGIRVVRPGAREVDVAPASAEAICSLLLLAHLRGLAVRTRLFPFGAESASAGAASMPLPAVPLPTMHLDLRGYAGIVEHSPDDLTMTVRAGTRMAVLQDAASARGQWLPLDPPAEAAMTIGEVIAKNEWGPRRTGYGTIRDYLLGLRFVLPGGAAVRTGSRVVKAATGYDIHRLQVGALESMGVALEATLRLRPLPAAAATVEAELATRHATLEGAMGLRALPDPPVALFFLEGPTPPLRLVARFEGHAAAVEAAAERAAAAVGGRTLAGPDAERALSEAREASLEPGFRVSGRAGIALRVTCRPSRLAASLEAVAGALAPRPVSVTAHPAIAAADLYGPLDARESPDALFAEAGRALAKVGSGSVSLRRPFERAAALAREDAASSRELMERIKQVADPTGLLNPGVLPWSTRG
jgi:glycolate dehydrogenase FAD-binding subunit